MPGRKGLSVGAVSLPDPRALSLFLSRPRRASARQGARRDSHEGRAGAHANARPAGDETKPRRWTRPTHGAASAGATSLRPHARTVSTPDTGGRAPRAARLAARTGGPEDGADVGPTELKAIDETEVDGRPRSGRRTQRRHAEARSTQHGHDHESTTDTKGVKG